MKGSIGVSCQGRAFVQERRSRFCGLPNFLRAKDLLKLNERGTQVDPVAVRISTMIVQKSYVSPRQHALVMAVWIQHAKAGALHGIRN